MYTYIYYIYICKYVHLYTLCTHTYTCIHRPFPCTADLTMGWLRLVGSFKLQVSFAKEPYKRDDILQKTDTSSLWGGYD